MHRTICDYLNSDTRIRLGIEHQPFEAQHVRENSAFHLMCRFGRRGDLSRCALHLSTASWRTARSHFVLSTALEPYAATVDATLYSIRWLG